MKLDTLIKKLTELSDEGHGKDEVWVLRLDDNPIDGDGSLIRGVYSISGHPDKLVNGVYIDGTD